MKKTITLQTVKSLFAYIGCIGIAVAVKYLINGTVGVLLIISLICALILSVVSALAVIPSLEVDVQPDKRALFKGESLIYAVSMRKRIIIPAPMIEVYVECTPQLLKDTDILRLSLAGRETNTVKISVMAKYSGAAAINITNVFVCDYFGIFRFRLKKDISNSNVRVSVYPNIPDVPVQTNFLKTAVLFSTDDNEEETNETALTPTGQPGYDHREYYPGDPIKRINWKMSSKKDVYMIRLDEKVAGGGQVFFLDVPELEENEVNLSVRDRVIEGMLAVFSMLTAEGRETVFFMPNKNNWVRMDIRTPADIYEIQQRLSDFSPCSMETPVPPEIAGMGKTPICFTAATGDNAQSAMNIISEIPDILLICSSDSKLPHITSEFWSISNTFEVKRL